MAGKTRTNHYIQPGDLYQISRLVTLSEEWKPALDQVAGLVRSFLIFDNLAVYLKDANNDHLEVVYAKAVGRGRNLEADIAWGEIIATRVTESQEMILEEPKIDSESDRLDRPLMLAIPLKVYGRKLGVIIFIRFGGPTFSSEDIHLSSFIADQIALLIERQNLQQQYNQLELKHRQAQLQEDFVSTITHELRSPLGFIKGYTTTLLRADTTWDQQTQQEFLKIIDQETDHLQELIENLLDSARLQSGQLDMRFQPVRLDALMNDVVMRAQHQHPNLVIELSTAPDLKPIQGNPRRLSQVFENLLSNAVKYAPSSKVVVTIEQKENHSHIYLQDFGPGISEKYLPLLFTRFFRNPDQAPGIHGTGLGLFICKQIIQAHYGEITATSTVGEGTTFHIVLPS
jgi:signal transduction histidine kinase